MMPSKRDFVAQAMADQQRMNQDYFRNASQYANQARTVWNLATPPQPGYRPFQPMNVQQGSGLQRGMYRMGGMR